MLAAKCQMLRLRGLVCRAHGPPSVGDPAVQAFLQRLMPTCLPKAVLSKGIQHSDALVRYATLCTLLKVVQIVQAELQTLQTNIQTLAALPAQTHMPEFHSSGLTAPSEHSETVHGVLSEGDSEAAISGGLDAVSAVLQQQQQLQAPFLNTDVQQQAQSTHTQWTGFLQHLQQSLRPSLPDPQSLLAVLSTLHKTAPQAQPNDAEEAGRAVDLLMHDSLQDESQQLHHAPETKAERTDSAGLEMNMTAPELTASVVLMVLTAYQHCLPEAMSDSHVDILSLMPQVSCELRAASLLMLNFSDSHDGTE